MHKTTRFGRPQRQRIDSLALRSIVRTPGVVYATPLAATLSSAVRAFGRSDNHASTVDERAIKKVASQAPVDGLQCSSTSDWAGELIQGKGPRNPFVYFTKKVPPASRTTQARQYNVFLSLVLAIKYQF
jgi:hypothetical protein